MSGLPYKFEPGMQVRDEDGEVRIVAYVLHGTSQVVWHEPEFGAMRCDFADVEADLDHPCTRGLLLQQYRDASGNPDAVAIRDDGSDWIVDRDPASTYSPVVGRGESEGAAILDALAQLAAERARESEQAKSVEGSEAIVQAMFVEVAQRLRAVERRMSELERKVGQ